MEAAKTEKKKRRKNGKRKKLILTDILVDMIFPRRCPVCDSPLWPGKYICEECRKSLKLLRGPVCFKCGKKLSDSDGEYCTDCLKRRHLFERGRALYEYEGVRKPIYRFKYSGRREYAKFFGDRLAEYLGKEIKEWKIDGIIPVPIHRKRRAKRGYNQSLELAKVLSEKLNIPLYENKVIRAVNTVPMKELGANERQINLKNAFIVHKDDVKLECVLIVDDIYTTGSTIDAMAKVLKAAGTRKVYFVALAVGVGL